jgi:hypothetical protein
LFRSFCFTLPANTLDDSESIEELERFIDKRYLRAQRNMSLVSEDSSTVKDNKPNQQNKQTKAMLAKWYQRWNQTFPNQTIPSPY